MYPDPSISHYNGLWTWEYYLSKVFQDLEAPDVQGDIFFMIEYFSIRSESIDIIRSVASKQVSEKLSPVAFMMIWESLRALALVKNNYFTINDLSAAITPSGNEQFIDKMFKYGENPPTDIAKNLLKLLYKKNVPHDHAAVQWTKEFLKTRGLDQVNFDLYLKELRRIPRVKDESASESTLSSHQKKLAKEMIWYLSGKRSWKTGKEINNIEDSILHHIRHKRNPWKTLYGGVYDTLPNFALVEGKQENSDVELQNERQHWEDTFIYMWEQFKKGNFKEATAHWDPRLQAEFLRERQTQQNLDPWLSQI